MIEMRKYYKLLKNDNFKISDELENETLVSFQWIIDELIKMYKKDNLVLTRLVTTYTYERMHGDDEEYYIVNYLLMNKDLANHYTNLYSNNNEENVIKIESKEFYPTEETKKIEKEIMNSSKFIIKNKYSVPTGHYAREHINYKFSNYTLETISLFSQYGSPTFIISQNIETKELIEITLKLLQKIKYNQLQQYNKELELLKSIRSKIMNNQSLSNKEQKKLLSLLNNEKEMLKSEQNLLTYTLKK